LSIVGVSGFPFLGVPFPRKGNPPGFRVITFLGTANPLGFLAPDVPKPGFRVPMNPEPTVEFAFLSS
jgi:hypothetical protein